MQTDVNSDRVPQLAEHGRSSSSPSPSPSVASAAPMGDRDYRRLSRALSQKERLGDLAGMASCYIQLGDLLLARGDSEAAGDMYRRSLRLARAAQDARRGLRPEDLT